LNNKKTDFLNRFFYCVIFFFNEVQTCYAALKNRAIRQELAKLAKNESFANFIVYLQYDRKKD